MLLGRIALLETGASVVFIIIIIIIIIIIDWKLYQEKIR